MPVDSTVCECCTTRDELHFFGFRHLLVTCVSEFKALFGIPSDAYASVMLGKLNTLRTEPKLRYYSATFLRFLVQCDSDSSVVLCKRHQTGIVPMVFETVC